MTKGQSGDMSEAVLVVTSDHPSAVLLDVHSGQVIQSFKPCKAIGPNSVTKLGSPNSPQFAALHKDKGVFAVYSHDRDQPWLQCPVPEKLTVLCASSTARLLAAGSQSGKLYLWDAPSGHLLAVVDAHFQKVTCIAFSMDDMLIATGSADATVKVYETTRLINQESDMGTLLHTFVSHTLHVSCILFAKSPSTSARLVTASHDHTVQVHDLVTGRTCASIIFPLPVHTMALDALDERVYVGGGAHVYASELVQSHDVRDSVCTLDKSHSVSQLVVSSCNSFMVVGTSNGSLCVMDTQSGILRSLATQVTLNSPIVYLHIYALPVLELLADSNTEFPLVAPLARIKSVPDAMSLSLTPLVLPPKMAASNSDRCLDHMSLDQDPLNFVQSNLC